MLCYASHEKPPKKLCNHNNPKVNCKITSLLSFFAHNFCWYCCCLNLNPGLPFFLKKYESSFFRSLPPKNKRNDSIKSNKINVKN